MSRRLANTRVLVTGAAGMMGRALLAELHAAGVAATALTRADADLTDEPATLAAFRRVQPELVFHLASYVRGILGNAGQQGVAFRDNVRINTNVIEAARLVGAHKIVAMGSAAIYGDQVPLPMREADIWIGPPHPSEAGYAHAKRAMLAQLDAYAQQWDLDWAYAVSTNLFGPHDRFDEQTGHVIPSLISKFARAARDGGPVTVWGTGTPRRDFLYVRDAARALIRIAEAHTGPINLATGTTISIRDTVAILARIAGFRGEVVWDASKPDGQRLRDYDVSRLRALGVTPVTDLAPALAETYAWYLAANPPRRW